MKDIASSVLASPEARIFCGKLLEETGVMRLSMRDTDRETAYAEGMRAAGLMIYSTLWGLSETAPIECMSEYGKWAEDYETEEVSSNE